MFIIFQAEYFIEVLLFILCSKRSNIIRKVQKIRLENIGSFLVHHMARAVMGGSGVDVSTEKFLFLSSALQICKCITFVFCPVYKIQTLQIKQQNKQEKEGQVGKGKVHIFNSFCRMPQKKCKFFLVIVPFVDPIKWGYLHMLFINMRIWLNYFDHRWKQFFPLVCEQ